jgi:tetratricopeptide (TPR) repeat protein
MTRYHKTMLVSLLVFLPAGVAAAFYYNLMRPWSWPVIIGGELAIAVAAFVINQLVLMVPLRRRFMAAVNRDDPDAVDAVLAEIVEMWPRNRKVLAAVDANRIVALTMRERYDEAVVVARRVLDDPQHKKQEPLLLNNLAWALAHTGALHEAAEAGERALALASTTHLRSFANGTLGAVYALRGEGDRALRHLDDADGLERGGAAFQATRQYYRGVALESKRRMDDAVRAYEAVRSSAPDALFGRKAAARLAALQSSS